MTTTTPSSALRFCFLGLIALALLGTAVPPAGASGVDTTAPVVTGTMPRTILWPPFGMMLPVGLNASANDDCDGAIDVVVRIYSDEPNTAIPFPPGPDASGISGVQGSLRLRGERLVPGTPVGNAGRCYVVSLSATDAAGNTGQLCLGAVCPIAPWGMGIMAARAELAAGQALCAANGGVIPPGMGWTELIPPFTLPPPIKAGPDAYTCIGNCRLTVPAPGVLSNDSTISPPLSITTAGAFASTLGGDVVLAADGSFTYDPPAGTTSTVDTFTYGILDAFGRTTTGTVSITLDEMIWFLDNSAGAGGDGRQTSPFNSFAAFTSTAADSTGDVIYVDLGDSSTLDYDTGLTLLDDQELYGEGVSLAANVSFPIPSGNSLPGAGTRPLITNGTGTAITAATGNTIRGLDISAPTGAGVFASGTDLTVSEMLISGAGTDGITFSSVAGIVDIDNVDVNAASGNGFNLLSCTASFDFDSNCSVINASGIDFRVSGGTCAVTYNGDLSQSTAGRLVDVAGSHATGAIVFQTGTVGCTSGSGIRLGPCSSTTTFSTAMSLTTTTAAIVLSGSTGTTNFNGLTIASLGDGLVSSGGGTINATGTNSVTATGGAGIDIESAALSLTFASITSTSGSNGIRLFSTTGSFQVTGLTDIDTPTGDGILIGSSPAVDFDFGTIDIDAGTADGIDISGGVGDFDVSGQTEIDGTSGWGVRVATSASDTFTFADTDVGLSTSCAEGVQLTSSAGATFTFSDLDITTGAGAGLVCDTAGTLNITGSPAIEANGGAAIDIESTNGDVNGTGFTFASPISTNSPTVGIRFDTTSEIIRLDDVDIDSNSTMIEQGIEFTDCTGATKTVSGGHVIFTGTNNGNGILIDNSDNVTIEGAPSSPWDPIGTSPTFVPNLSGGFEISGMGTGSTLQTLNGNSTGHHAINCHDSNGLTVRRCEIRDIGDLTNADAHIDAGIFIDETTGGTVTVNSNFFADIAGSPCLLIGDPSSLFTGTSTFNFTFNRVVGDPDEPNAGNPNSNIQNAVQAAFDSTSGATIVGNFDDNRIEGVSFTGIQVAVDLNVASGNTGTGGGGRCLFSASRNFISDVDNECVEFAVSDDSESRIIVDDNTFDASNLHTSFDFGPQIAVDIDMAHDGATLTPVMDLFIRNNTIESTNAATQNWTDNGIRVETSSASGAGAGIIRALVSDNTISEVEAQAIELQSDEDNTVSAIVRDNTIDSSDSVLSSLQGVIDLDTQSGSDASVLRVWLDGNETGSPNAGGVDVGYRIEEDTSGNPDTVLACEASCPVSGTITTNADLISLLSHNGNTSDTGGAPTVDSSAGNVVVVTTAAIAAPSLKAAQTSRTMVGNEIVGETEEDKAPLYDLLEVAKAMWIDAGINESDRRILDSITIGVADLEGDLLAKTWITHITLDTTAAGHGWFLDATPEEHSEFTTKGLKAKAAEAKGAMDLLTVLMHEIGHAIGRDHCSCPGHVMSHDLVPGERRLLKAQR